MIVDFGSIADNLARIIVTGNLPPALLKIAQDCYHELQLMLWEENSRSDRRGGEWMYVLTE